EDVKRLGALVGEVIADQEGEAFFERVEALRRVAIQRREQGEGLDALAAAVDGLPLDEAEGLVRSFATYFGVGNLAERIHRIRRRRDYQKQATAAPQPGGLLAVVSELKAAGVEFDELVALFRRPHTEREFTAHPTRPVRRPMPEQEAE
ncbi:phosphoenolpyruvate carboxylase, partial [Vogesella mureinivorans]|uniref:phosphoenolpyruvate carboxylase n=1 Tax=Vogesella mureinivorans TaxID=657276 RepID=UPI001F112850